MTLPERLQRIALLLKHGEEENNCVCPEIDADTITEAAAIIEAIEILADRGDVLLWRGDMRVWQINDRSGDTLVEAAKKARGG